MGQMQELNPHKDTASNDQILFLVINASSVTVVPTTIVAFRAQLGAANPADVFLPILVATYCSTMAGLLVTGLIQRLRLWDKVVLAYLGGMTAIVGGLVAYFTQLDQAALEAQSSLLANGLIFGMILGGVRALVETVGGDTRWVEGLPTMLMKPLSGSGARGTR